MFQYRKRYEVTCDLTSKNLVKDYNECFNTASGMRSYVTADGPRIGGGSLWFQYRKRYEVTCDAKFDYDLNASI